MRDTVAAVAKRARKTGTSLDGEGAVGVWGKAHAVFRAADGLPVSGWPTRSL